MKTKEQKRGIYLTVLLSPHFCVHNLEIFIWTSAKVQKSLADFGIPGTDILCRVRLCLHFKYS